MTVAADDMSSELSDAVPHPMTSRRFPKQTIES